MSDEVISTVIAEIVKKVKIEDGDILIVRTANDDVRNEFVLAINDLYKENPLSILLVEEDQIDILREADEEMMREFGWQRIVE